VKTLAEKKRDALLSRASSRRELAGLMHDVVLPLLTQQANNMEFLKRRYDEMEARLKALEPVPPSEEPHV